jgi:glycosyltransferase involved in cell wall biosynthesis
MNKKVGIYDPYLDTLGGGERYCLSVAELLKKNGYEVDLFWSGTNNLLTQAQDRFNLDLTGINIVPDIFNEVPHKIDLIDNTENISKITSIPRNKQNLQNKIRSFLQKYKITRKYDVFFYLSDWSIPFLFAKNNFLHIQVPFISKTSITENILNNIKIRFFKEIICNSNFTQRFANNQFGSKCHVVYPPVDIEKFTGSHTKENYILSVGRFDNLLNTKRQEVLIDAFKKIYQQNRNTGWKLILAGGSLESPDKNMYLQHLKFLSSDLPVEFYVSPSFTQLKDLYSKSKIYWHAAGYEVDENIHPENTEHFGIAPVEAMASGQVPVVVAKGGLPEIIDNEKTGYLWNTINELVSKTQLLIASPDRLKTMSQNAILRSKDFSKENFSSNFMKFLRK